MLESVKISGYRSCLDTTFNPQPDLSVLIGPNGSGKTNILKAILLLRKLSYAGDWYDSDELDATSEPQIQVGLKHKNRHSVLTLEASLNTDRRNDDAVLDFDPSWTVTERGKTFERPVSVENFVRRRIMRLKKGLHDTLPFEAKYRRNFEDMVDLFSRMKYYSAAQFVNPTECPVSIEVEQGGRYRTGARLRGHDRFLFDLYVAKERETAVYQKFFSLIGPEGLQLVDIINFKEVETSQTDVHVRAGGALKKRNRKRNLVIPQFRIGKNVLSPNQLSEGTFRTIALFFYIMTDDSRILLIEEPEVCVHQGLLSSLVELIKICAKQKQIIISTHSDFVLDQVEPRNVYKVLMSPRGTKVTQVEESLSVKELTALKSYLREEGNLGEYWRHGGLG